MLNKNVLRILVPIFIGMVAVISGGICFSEDLWTGAISKITVTDIDSETSKIDIVLDKNEENNISFDQSKTISIETGQLERKTKIYLDGVNPAKKTGFCHKKDKLISELKISRISGSISNPSIQATNDGAPVYSTLIDIITNKTVIVNTVSKEKNGDVEITITITASKEQDLSLQTPSIIDITSQEFDNPLSKGTGTNIDEKMLKKMSPDDFITAVFPLQHIDPATAKTIVENELSSRGRVQVYLDKSQLIVTDTVSYIRSIRKLIENIDIKVPQVLIEARIFEVSYDKETEIGIDWSLTRPSVTATIGHGLNTAVKETRGTELIVRGLLGDRYKRDALFATIDALVSEGKAKIAARPKVVVLNNQKAVIISGDNIPYRKENYDNRAAGVGAGTRYFITDFLQTGITLTVTPHVRNNDLIVLNVKPEVKYIIGYKGEYDMPVFSTRSTDTVVSVKNGDTLVIGGLFKEGKKTIEHGIPLLKDIPILGYLFKHKRDINIKTEVVICITTTLI
ncbi:MAG: secretin N-terminal domain-containing protein [bacterium]|nr:secretin N-terminal domain-containing protein [bacterium]